MTDKELVKRLRGWAKDIQEGSTAIYAMDLDLKNAASSIEALTAKLDDLQDRLNAANKARAHVMKMAVKKQAKLFKAVEALRNIAVVGFSSDPSVNAAIAKQTVTQARATLEEIEGEKG
jgi:hypothetical protein